MSEDQKVLTSFPGQPSAEGETPQREAGQGSEGPTGFTRKEAEDFLNQRLSTFEKEIQSRTDKSLSHVKKDVTGIRNTLKFLKDQGMEITPAQEKALEDAAFKEAILKDEQGAGDPDLDEKPKDVPSGQPTQQQPSGQQSDESSDLVKAELLRIYQEEGQKVFESDPEAKIINESKTFEELLQNARKAAKQKAMRVNRLPSSPGSSGGPSKGTVMEYENDDALWNEIKDDI